MLSAGVLLSITMFFVVVVVVVVVVVCCLCCFFRFKLRIECMIIVRALPMQVKLS